VGGRGNDVYNLENGRDIVSDSAGIDTITSTISRSLASYAAVERLKLLGTAERSTGRATRSPTSSPATRPTTRYRAARATTC